MSTQGEQKLDEFMAEVISLYNIMNDLSKKYSPPKEEATEGKEYIVTETDNPSKEDINLIDQALRALEGQRKDGEWGPSIVAIIKDRRGKMLLSSNWAEANDVDADVYNEVKEKLEDLIRCAYRFARVSIKMGRDHYLLDEMLEQCKHFIESDFMINDVVPFVREYLYRYAVGIQEAGKSNKAFEFLLGGVDKDRQPRTIRKCILALNWNVEQLSDDERKKFQDRLEQFKADFKRQDRTAEYDSKYKTLVEGIERYCKILNAISWAKNKRKADVKPGYGNKAIAVVSSKGGVGKSTLAMALALDYASKGRRVCLVDADVEGPCIRFYSNNLVIETKQQKLDKKERLERKYGPKSFSQWINRPDSDFPLSNMHSISIPEKRGSEAADNIKNNLMIIPGSILSIDVNRSDTIQRSKRPLFKAYPYVMKRVHHLLNQLIDSGNGNRFDHVIFDTGPGIGVMDFDIMLAVATLGGIPIFVMRPRPGDVLAFMEEYSADLKIRNDIRLLENAIVCENVVRKDHIVDSIEESWGKLIKRMYEMPKDSLKEIFRVESDTAEEICRTIGARKVKVQENEDLRHIADYYGFPFEKSPMERLFEIVKDQGMGSLGAAVHQINEIIDGYEPSAEQVADSRKGHEASSDISTSGSGIVGEESVELQQ